MAPYQPKYILAQLYVMTICKCYFAIAAATDPLYIPIKVSVDGRNRSRKELEPLRVHTKNIFIIHEIFLYDSNV